MNAMRRFAIFLLLPVLFSCAQKKENLNESKNTHLHLFVGTYTGDKGDGIYLLDFELETGRLGNLRLAAETSNPSYLAISPDRKALYSVNANDSGAVTAFFIDQQNGSLTFSEQQPTYGSGPCYVAACSSGNKIAVANYRSGNIAIYGVADGKFTSRQVRQHQGSGPHPTRQEGPHAHFCEFANNDNILYAVDLGVDAIVAHPMGIDGFATQSHIALKLDGGDGPRHMAFHNNFVFIVNELSNSVVSAKADHAAGRFEKIDRISTLPDEFEGENYCADIHISRDGKRLYASNRGHNSLAIFAISPKGRLKKLGIQPTGGEWPRNFTLSPDGNFLLVANQRSDNIVVFRIDKTTGMLSPTGFEAEVPSPVCLKFY